MTIDYKPDPRARTLAEKALSMKVSIQAVLAHLDEEREKYRRKLTAMADMHEDTRLRYSTDDSVTDADIDRIEQVEQVLGTGDDVESTLDDAFGVSEQGIRSLAHIDGTVLSAVDVQSLLREDETREMRRTGLARIIEIALWQAHALLEYNEYVDAHLVNEAEGIVRERLGLQDK